MSPERMKKEENRSSTAFLKFKTIYHHKSHCLFCFFEGEDDIKYYYFRIKENLPNIEWEGISCGGKQIVLNIHQCLKKHEDKSYQQAKKAFFVDKDFDEPLEDLRQEIYETPCYSIENFYTSMDCFKSIVKYEFKISEFDEKAPLLFQYCVDSFSKTQQAFHEVMIEFNAWIMVGRRSRVDLNLSKYDKIDNLVKLEVNSVVQSYTIGDLLDDLPKGKLYEEEIKQISFSDHRCQFRGKQELQFFVKFLTKLKDYLSATKSKKISFQIPESNPLSALTQYADTPQCLRHYLTNFAK